VLPAADRDVAGRGVVAADEAEALLLLVDLIDAVAGFENHHNLEVGRLVLFLPTKGAEETLRPALYRHAGRRT
jgi:hypothetical protein